MREFIQIVEAAQRPAAERYISTVYKMLKRIGPENIVVYLEPEGDTQVSLDSIDAPVQGHGYGTRAMDVITKQADAFGVTITLAVTEDQPDPIQSRLIRWYRRYGFVVVSAEPDGEQTWFNLERKPATV